MDGFSKAYLFVFFWLGRKKKHIEASRIKSSNPKHLVWSIITNEETKKSLLPSFRFWKRELPKLLLDECNNKKTEQVLLMMRPCQCFMICTPLPFSPDSIQGIAFNLQNVHGFGLQFLSFPLFLT